MIENGSMENILNLAEDAWGLYQHSLGVTPQDTTFKRLHVDEAKPFDRTPPLDSLDKFNQRIIELSLRSLQDKKALDQLADEMMEHYQSISIQLECQPDMISFVDNEVLYKILIRNQFYVFVEAWKQDVCVQSVPMVNTAQFVVFIRRMDRLAERLSIIDNPQTDILKNNLAKIKAIADQFRPEWHDWAKTYSDKRLHPFSLYYDKRDAQEYNKKMSQLMGKNDKINDDELRQAMMNSAVPKMLDTPAIKNIMDSLLGDTSDIKDSMTTEDLLERFDPSSIYEAQGRAIVGQNSLDDKLLDLDRRMKQIREKVPELSDIFQPPPSIIHLIKKEFYAKEDESCLSLLRDASTSDKEQFIELIESFSEKILREHASFILKANAEGLLVFDPVFLKQVLPFLVDEHILSPLTKDNDELKEMFFAAISLITPETAAQYFTQPHQEIRNKAEQAAEKVFALKQEAFREIALIDNTKERAEARVELVMQDLLDAIKLEFGAKI